MISPLSQSQYGIYYACSENSDIHTNYQVPFLYKLPDSIDTERFIKAVDAVLKSHPYLNSHIVVSNGVHMMETHGAGKVKVTEVEDIEPLKNGFRKAMDIEHDCLSQFELFKTASGNYFLINIHHILFDGTSFNILSEDISKAYNGEIIFPETTDGAKVANDELQARESEEWNKQKQWYLNEFSSLDEIEYLPEASTIDRNDANGITKREFVLDISDKNCISRICKKYSVRKSTVFCAAWGKMLANFTAENKSTFHTIHNGRTEETSRTITMMVKTLPVYMDMPSEKSIALWLEELTRQQDYIRTHTTYSFTDAFSDFNFQSRVMFAYQGRLAQAKDFEISLGNDTIVCEDLRLPRPSAILDTQVFNIPGLSEEKDYLLRVEFDSNKYSNLMIESMVDSFTSVIRSMESAETIGELRAASDSQTEWLDSRNPSKVLCTGKTVVELFKEKVLEFPDKECCIYLDKRFTYKQISDITDKLAAKIQSLVPEKSVVSFVSERNELMFIFPTAIAKAGCTYQPLDTSYPKERLSFMIKDSGAGLFICPSIFRNCIDGYEGKVLEINNVDEIDFNLEYRHPSIDLEDTLVLLYTSGTTGTPKGVMISQKNAVSMSISHKKVVGLDESSRVCVYASYGFDANVMDLWSSLISGAAQHILGEDQRYDLVAIKDFIVREHITHAFMTTQVATQLAINFPEIEGFKCLYTGGEKLVSIDPPAYRMFNMYGPTESLCYVCYSPVNKKETNIPIGHTTETAMLYVVNKDGKRVPLGASGELWITGSQVAKGYLNLPEKTAVSFIPNPFGEGTVYRSGDIVRYREDGEIEYIGRKDGQVKIRGFRIELKEVEAVIREYPGMKEVTVQAFDLDAGGKAIAAYIVADNTVDIAELNNFIGDQKPAYMIPAVIMQIDAIPLNVNGKVDKKRLPKPQVNITSENDVPAAPLNILEKEIEEMVCKLTDCAEFPITTQLAYTGLTSISSLKLSTELFKKYGISVDSRQLGKNASVQSIENIILEKLLTTKASTDPVKDAVKPEESFEAPLSNAQTGVYYECLKNSTSTTYNVPTIFTFPEGISSQDIKAAVEKVIAAHPLLSAVIDNTVDPPVQRFQKGVEPQVVISEKSADELKKDFVKPFDLANGPLYRAAVCGNVLLLDVHHLVMDGTSLSIFLNQVCQVLEGKEISKEDCTFFEYARKEQASDMSSAEEFFSKQLAETDEATVIPTDLHGNEGEGRPAEAVVPVCHSDVENFAKKHGVTPASVYLAAVEYLAGRYANTKNVCLFTVSSGRGDVRVSDTVGMFVNTLTLVSKIGEGSVGDYISDVSENFSRTLENEKYPFAKISDRYGISPELVFVYEVGVIEDFTVKGKKVRMSEMALSSPKFKITILVEERDSKICLVSQYNDALYSADSMARMMESLNQVIINMISSPSADISGISIVSESQKKELETMNNVRNIPVPVKILHKGIERWVSVHPDKPAVIATDKTLTYCEFDKAANRIANALIGKGLKKGDAVVVLLPRDSRTICTLYGVNKAGGAFIPCDPEYPTERIQLIAEDSCAPYVVTTSSLVGNYGSRGINVDELLAFDIDTNPGIDVQPEDLVYYIFTSGSTGRPKGVRVAHGNITTMATVDKEHPLYPISQCQRLMSVATISFDAFIMDYIQALFNGNTLVFANEEEAKNPIALVHLMHATNVEYFCGTSSRILQYLELPEFALCLKKIKVIIQGGEKFSGILLKKLKSMSKTLVILNGYGPTEIGISCNTANLQEYDYITVGRPQPNYTEWIIDKDGNELPVGVTGELCVGGNAVTQGYNNLPELTAEKFISYRGMRAFKTGDYGRWHEDGAVEILGRTDNQVKLRGLRIELGEVESAISRIDGIKNVFVKICKIQEREHLSAYYVADRTIETSEIKKEISKTLTSYMVPTAYLQMESFPVTPNGKVDFRHMPEPLIAKAGGEYEAPANQTEKFFADTFAEILQTEKVSANDSFFDLGGTSLVVMKLVISAQKAGYQLTYSDIFENPTPRQLAVFLGKGASEKDDPDADIKDFNYSEIDSLLEKNTLESYLGDRSVRPLGNVLLTGATGFLGIHIFKYLLDYCPETKIHCLLRSSRGIAAENRLNQLMFYYFERKIEDLTGKRVFIHEGDITKAIEIDTQIDTVINCAALVKHFAKGTEIEDVNVGGVANCIDFCLKKNARLIQISTYSVGGTSVNGVPEIKAFNEQMLFKGQRIHNQYVHSKIMGERMILDAIAGKGLDAKIMRVGNLSARSEDGEFQINQKANSFMGRLRIYQMLGVQPYSEFQSKVEFSPIDETAKAICTLSCTNGNCVVFHPYNSHYQMLGDILTHMSTIGKNLRLVENDEFLAVLNEAKADPDKQEQLSAMLAYESNDEEFVQTIAPDNTFTMQVLLRLGFHWTMTSWDYIDQFLHQIDALLFFEDKK